MSPTLVVATNDESSDLLAEERAPARIRVLIAEDHPLIIAGLRRTLEDVDDIEVVGEAHTLSELVYLIERRGPSIVMMDLRMPGTVGARGIEEVRRRHPDLKLVVLSASDDRSTIDAALAAGANAYIVKSAHALDVAAVLRQTSNGAVFHAPSPVLARGEHCDHPRAPRLTHRERTILSAVASGQTTATISQELWVSEHTVKFHLTNIYRKLGVSNRASAVRYALEHDLVA